MQDTSGTSAEGAGKEWLIPKLNGKIKLTQNVEKSSNRPRQQEEMEKGGGWSYTIANTN